MRAPATAGGAMLAPLAGTDPFPEGLVGRIEVGGDELTSEAEALAERIKARIRQAGGAPPRR